MKKILLIGAGRSTISLIDYLLENLEKEDWTLLVGDQNVEFAESKIGNNKRATAIAFDVTDDNQRSKEIEGADIVISMLPAHMHVSVAKDCIRFKKNMVTASYVSKEMRALEQEAIANGVTIINEIGVDPGIDHLSAMKVIDEIREKGGKVIEFETFTGGLVAPESDNNPWNYKFTWNPRNVVLAGQGGAVKFIQSGTYKYIPYHKLFGRTEIIDVDSYGKFEGYANRDSLTYRSVYQLEDVKTMYRGTLRRPGYSKAWNVFVQLGATDDSYQIENSDQMTFRDFINLFLAYNPNDSVELKLKYYLNMRQDEVELFDKLEWLDIFKPIKIPLKNATPAQILQYILERKWTLSKEDKDMIVMWHKFVYELDGQVHELHSSMVVKGEDSLRTAMAKTVGYPVAIAAKMLLKGIIDMPGVQIPIAKEIYEPVLEELKKYGVNFKEKMIH
jgi:saccharopine dehydrogenase-like NADP-dependent oxidoreductase